MGNPAPPPPPPPLRPQLRFQARLLCVSCLYLFTSLFLAVYLSLSPTHKCLFLSSPFDPIQSPLFSYPPSYREEKHSLPTLRDSCSSPVFFSDYWSALKEMRDSCKNWTDFTRQSWRYMQGNADSFGGNLNLQNRISFFDEETHAGEVPCGFLKPFPIHDYDKIAMESCNEVVVVSAIFGDHDKIRQPKDLGYKTLDVVCFFMFVDDITLKGLSKHNLISISPQSHQYTIGAWRLVNVSTKGLYRNPAMNGVIPKYLVHRLFPNAKYSIWVDAKLQLMVDPLLLIHSLLVKEGADMAISKHPFFKHTMEEAMATARWRKWMDIDGLRMQMETYCENGLRPWSPNKLPYPSDVPDTALIVRRHGERSNLFSCLMFNELEAFNHRDQLPFAFVRDKLNPKLLINMFDSEVFEHIVMEYRHNLNKHSGPPIGPNIKRVRPTLSDGNSLGKCEGYFLDMWGDTQK